LRALVPLLSPLTVRPFCAQPNRVQETCKSLRAKFMQSGPSSPGMDLDIGLDLVREYKHQLGEVNHQKEALVNAQKLFGIDVTRYPELQVWVLLVCGAAVG
jgi:dynein heavy chain